MEGQPRGGVHKGRALEGRQGGGGGCVEEIAGESGQGRKRKEERIRQRERERRKHNETTHKKALQ